MTLAGQVVSSPLGELWEYINHWIMMPLCLLGLLPRWKTLFWLWQGRGVVPSEEARRLIVAQVLEQWGVDPNPKTSLWALWRHAGDVSSCPSWWSRKTTCVTTTTTTSAKEKEKTLVLLLYNSVQMLAYFLHSVILSQMPKKAILPW